MVMYLLHVSNCMYKKIRKVQIFTLKSKIFLKTKCLHIFIFLVIVFILYGCMEDIFFFFVNIPFSL